ncbi:hypothetical protein PLESTM_000991100 [Pleodorina starrii]|nr:hypothetical protein PLESTM_000991100 [Pleodorina starrii]
MSKLAASTWCLCHISIHQDIGTVNLDISGLSDTALGQVDGAYKCWALVYSGAPSDSGTVFCVHDEHHTASSAAAFLIGRSNDTHDLSIIRTDIQIHEKNLGPHLLTLVLNKWITKSGVMLALNAAILSGSAVINDIGTVNLDISGLSDTALGQVDGAYKCWALVYSGAPSDSGTVFCVHDEHHTASSAAAFLIGRSNDTHDLSIIRTDIQIHEKNLGPHLLTLVLNKWITKSGVMLALNAAILSGSAVINDIGTVNLDISGLSDTALGQVDGAYKCWALVYSGAPSDSGTVFCVHDEHHTASSAAAFLIGRSNDTHDLSIIRTDIQIHEKNLGPHLLTLVLNKWITKSGVMLALNAAILSGSAVINSRYSGHVPG